jgi:hypothetical protein
LINLATLLDLNRLAALNPGDNIFKPLLFDASFNSSWTKSLAAHPNLWAVLDAFLGKEA